MTRMATDFAARALMTLAEAAWSADQKLPGTAVITIGTGPVPLLVHYLDGIVKPVQVGLRDIHHAKPELA